jgi:ribose transport system substrate-binding protein
MRYLTAVMLAGLTGLLAGHALAADNQMTIAVFTKNRTNPAYEAFRIASD